MFSLKAGGKLNDMFFNNLFFRYSEQISGLQPANSSAHGLYIDLEPTMGAPLSIQVRFQVNLVIEPDSNFPPLSNITSPLTVLPTFWAQEGFENLGATDIFFLKLALALPSYVTYGSVIIALLVAMGCFAWPVMAARRAALASRAAAADRSLLTGPSVKAVIMYNMVPTSEEGFRRT